MNHPDTWPTHVTLLLVASPGFASFEWRCYMGDVLDEAIGNVKRADKILATAVVPIDWKPAD